MAVIYSPSTRSGVVCLGGDGREGGVRGGNRKKDVLLQILISLQKRKKKKKKLGTNKYKLPLGDHALFRWWQLPSAGVSSDRQVV